MHFRRTRYKAGNRSAGERMAYITGQAQQRTQAQQQLEYSQRAGREDVVQVASRNLPAWAAGAQAYFEAAEQYERSGGVGPKNEKNKYAGVAFEEWKLTLPVELSIEQNKALAEDLMDVIAGDRLPCTYAFHNPKTLDGRHDQPHLHVLISARITDGIERTAAQHFRRWNSDDPASGGAQKAKEMNVYHATKMHRLMISDMLNVHLEYYGHRARIHPATLEQRAIDRKPEPKLRPSDSANYRQKQALSKTMLDVFRIRAARRETYDTEQANAQQYWEERKQFLGIRRGMSREEKVAHILYRRHGTLEHVPARYRPLVAYALSRGQRWQVEQERRQVGRELRSMRQRLAQLAAQVEASEAQGRGRLRVTLEDEEQGWRARRHGS